MSSALFEIINNSYYKEERKNEDYYYDDEDDEMPELPIMRRTRKTICSGCGNISSLYTPYLDHKVLCCGCSRLIRNTSKQMKASLDYKKDLLEKKKNLFQEIIELGLHPDRIRQTCPFETIYFFEQ